MGVQSAHDAGYVLTPEMAHEEPGVLAGPIAGMGGKIKLQQIQDIAKLKMPDLTASSLEAAVNTIAGSARSMGVEVEG